MKILIDIGHPAHVHLFKHFAWEMQEKGHAILFTCREKEFEIDLLSEYGFDFVSFGKKFNSTLGKIIGMLKFDLLEIITANRFKPDILLSCGSIYAAHASFIVKKPHITLEDTGNWEQVRLYLPFTSSVLTSDTFPFEYGKMQVRYKAHHELAYLIPGLFIPEIHFKRKLSLDIKDKYVIFRFVAWNASHDVGQKGLSSKMKRKLIDELSSKYAIYISSESKLPAEYEKYRLNFKPAEIHNALFYADFVISEGTTIAMESSVLGTPVIYINSLQYSNVKDMEAHGLLFRFDNDSEVLNKVRWIINYKDLKKEFRLRKERMLSEKINLTSLLIWFVENYPDSALRLNSDQDYQKRFLINNNCAD